MARATTVNGRTKVLNLANKSSSEIKKLMYELRDSCGDKNRRYKKNVYDGVKSVQGVWDPSTTFDSFSLKL